MTWPTFTLDGKRYAVVPAETLAEAGLGRETAEQRRRRQLCRALRAAREHAGLSQAELGERMGCSQAFISSAESGARIVGERHLAAVLRACGLPERWRPA